MTRATTILEGSMKSTISRLEKAGFVLFSNGVTANGRKAVVMAKGTAIKKFYFVTPSGLAQPTMDLSTLPQEYTYTEVV